MLELILFDILKQFFLFLCHHQVVHQINKGAYGQVVKVERQSDGQIFAMKVSSYCKNKPIEKKYIL